MAPRPEIVANSPVPGTATQLTTVNGALTSGATVIPTNAAAPVSLQRNPGRFRALIDQEIIIFDASTSGTTSWTAITRGAEGTTAATHSDKAPIYHIVTKDSLTSRPISVSQGFSVARAYRSTAFTAGTLSAFTKFPLNAISFDPSGRFDVTTNNRYNVPQDGYYQINASLYWSITTSGGDAGVAVRKNAVATSVCTSIESVPSDISIINVSCSDIIDCVAGDYLEMFYLMDETNSIEVATDQNYLSVVRVA